MRLWQRSLWLLVLTAYQVDSCQSIEVNPGLSSISAQHQHQSSELPSVSYVDIERQDVQTDCKPKHASGVMLR